MGEVLIQGGHCRSLNDYRSGDMRPPRAHTLPHVQVQLLISAQDVENYKVIKSELDRLRTMVEKSELWVDKKGSVKGEEVEAGPSKDKKEVSRLLGAERGAPIEGEWMTLSSVSSEALGRGGISAATWGEEQRELPDCERREWRGGQCPAGEGCPAAGLDLTQSRLPLARHLPNSPTEALTELF